LNGNKNVKKNFSKRIDSFTEDIKKYENLFEKTNNQRYLNIANNLRARSGELQFISKNYF
jgi:hypothetical protein